MAHTIAITLDDSLVQERDTQELQTSIHQGLILLDYVSARISVGRFAELMGMSIQVARDWLHDRGIPTVRRFSDPQLEAACDNNYRELADALGVSSDYRS